MSDERSIVEELWKVYNELPSSEAALKLKALELLSKMRLSDEKVKPVERDQSLQRALGITNGKRTAS